jgi:dTDP-4-dehydrorhamnose reductase
MKVVVIGAAGQLGAAVVREFAASHDLIPLGRQDLDLHDDRAIERAISERRPDVIINCAAYNHVDRAEDEPVEALNVNAFAVRALAQAANDAGAILVHYSSDFVFDGEQRTPYTEDDRPNPRSAYATSKLLGEWFASDCPRAYVLRVESLFGCAGPGAVHKGSVAAILNALRRGDEVRAFSDRTISPLYVVDGAHATRRLIELEAPFGLYHCVNSGHCTWVELARELADRLGVEARIVATRMSEMKLRADRPEYCVLSNQKLESVGISMPSWKDALRRYVEREKQG